MTYSAGYIAEQIGGQVIGDRNMEVHSISSPRDPKSHSVVFIKEDKAMGRLGEVNPLCVVVDFSPQNRNYTYIKIDPSKKEHAFIKLLSLFSQNIDLSSGVSPRASISSNASLEKGSCVGDFVRVEGAASIGSGTYVGPGVFIGGNCRIGNGCIIYPNVTIYPNTIIENNVIIHSGAVIGSEGFGYANLEGRNQKIPQVGGVYIESYVEIGANTTIDRSTIGYTRIGENTKIDNLVHVAHNVEIGRNTVICALSGISGSVKIGNNVVIAGAVGLKDHITIEDDVYIGAKAGVMDKVVKKGRKILGIPAINFKSEMEFIALKPKLKSMFFDLQRIKKKLGI
ncbi:MAG: UDP-3-O-(3-hydroxymyristoyl)glucosamine N-acyltransferase [Spirochaetota bacterium]